MARLPEPDPAASPELAAVFERVADSRGWVSNLLRSLAHAPEGLRVFSAVGHYGRYGTALTEVQREIVICVVGRRVPYAWAHHAPLGRQAGLTDAQLDDIAAGRAPATLAPPDRAVCDFALAVARGEGMPDEAMAAMLGHFTPRQVTDAALLAAYYIAAGALIAALGVEVEPPEVLQIELDWQRRQAAAG